MSILNFLYLYIKKFSVMLINIPFLISLDPSYFPFDHTDVYSLGCLSNAYHSLSLFISPTHSLYLKFNHCRAVQNEITQNLSYNDSQSHKFRNMKNCQSVRYNKGTSKKKGQWATYLHNLSINVTNLNRIIIYPLTDPQHNDNPILVLGYS
jgi:hypothetical protein